jgi:hypothetical protein
MIRCKFKCVSKKEMIQYNDPKPIYEFEFSAVTDGSEENKNFFKWTPSGSLKTGVVQQDVFVVGREYYIDISESVPSPIL